MAKCFLVFFTHLTIKLLEWFWQIELQENYINVNYSTHNLRVLSGDLQNNTKGVECHDAIFMPAFGSLLFFDSLYCSDLCSAGLCSAFFQVESLICPVVHLPQNLPTCLSLMLKPPSAQRGSFHFTLPPSHHLVTFTYFLLFSTCSLFL